MKAPRPPHVDRLLARVQGLDAPVVQLWAWPGSGQQTVLDALVAAGPRVAQPLSLEDLAEEGSLRRAVAGAVGGAARWLVLPAVPAPPPAAARAIAGLLPAGRRLLFAAPERHVPSPLTIAYVGPREHLVTAAEAAELWSAVTGRTPPPALLAALMAATDGWYRPLLLLAEAAAGGGGLDDGALIELPGVESFLRHEVLAGLPAAERELVPRLALAGTADPEPWAGLLDPDEAAALDRLHEVWGLALAGEDAVTRLPAPLAAWLAPAAREDEGAAELAVRLAAAERRRGRPVAALRVLAGAAATAATAGTAGTAGSAASRSTREPDREPGASLAELLDRYWPELLLAAPLGLLATAAARLPERRGPGAELIASLAAALLAPPAGIARQGAEEPPPDPAVAAAERLAAALLDDGVRGYTPDPALPPALEPLAVLAAALDPAAGAGGREDAEDDESEARGDDAVPAASVATALAALPPPAAGAPDLLAELPALPVPGPGAAGAPTSPGGRGHRAPAGADPRTPALSALAATALARLAVRRPALAAALGRRPELAAGWRQRLAAPSSSEARPPRGYELDLLGESRARRRDGSGVVELAWPLKRAFKALAFLATAPGRRAGRDELVEALWPGADDGRIRRNFHPTLSHLRRALEHGLAGSWAPPLLLDGAVYALNPALDWRIDAAELERLYAEGREVLERERVAAAVALWERARDLHRGPLLAGWDDPWIAARRERVQRLWLDLMRALGEAYTRLGRLDEAMDALRTVLIHDQLQERVHLALMHVYARQGRRDLVRKQYDRLAELLTRELSVEPAEEVTQAYHRLMA